MLEVTNHERKLTESCFKQSAVMPSLKDHKRKYHHGLAVYTKFVEYWFYWQTHPSRKATRTSQWHKQTEWSHIENVQLRSTILFNHW